MLYSLRLFPHSLREHCYFFFGKHILMKNIVSKWCIYVLFMNTISIRTKGLARIV